MVGEVNTPAAPNGAPTVSENPLAQSNLVVIPEERFITERLALRTTMIMAVERHVSHKATHPHHHFKIAPAPKAPSRNGGAPRASSSNYLDRFNEETHGMSDLDSIMVVGAVLDGLRECPFLDSLTRDVPRDLSEVMSRAQKYIASDEFKAGRKE
ncbi:hypothetical protein J5N97_003892 [Dioscorea zingiberensis]|uniref:Uncharacterized protein n=1 Tax=Dioscorea zingiberensis TaxID=325984 RepID=A0A9D5D540_9LILI|nr:hypothetical protein J5N97_003892 [Dioscorea zingiberensis]